jgi:hypothetical protein
MAKVMLRVGDPVPKSVTIPGSEGMPLYIPKDTIKGIRIQDDRSVNPTTGLPLRDTERKSVDVDPELVKSIVAHAKAQGIDPLTALSISYQETGLNKNAPFNLNPDVYKTSTGDPKYGVKTIVDQFKYAKDLQKRGIVPNTEEYLLQGYNGYGKIAKGHADLEGASRIYGYPIPEGGIDLRHNPLYGKTVISLRNILSKHPQIQDIIKNTPAYQEPKTMLKINK